MKNVNVYDLSSVAAAMRETPTKEFKLNRSSDIWSCGGKNSSVERKMNRRYRK